MCFNKEVSFVIAVFGIFCAIHEFKRQKVYSGLTMIVLSLMQINEFFLHVYNEPSTKMHQISAFMIPITICIQVISLFVASFYVTNISEEAKTTVKVLCGIYLLILIYFFIVSFIPRLLVGLGINKQSGDIQRFNSTLICKETGCRLNWDSFSNLRHSEYQLYKILYFISTTLYLIILGIMIYSIYGIALTIILFILVIMSFLISMYYKRKYNMVSNQSGSLWCIMTIIVFALAIIGND